MGRTKRLLSYLKPYRGRVIFALLLSFGVAAMTALSLSAIIPSLDALFEADGLTRVHETVHDFGGRISPGLADWVVTGPLATRFSTLASLLGAVAIMTILKGALRFAHVYLVGTVAIAAARDLTNQLFGHLIRQPVLFVEGEGVGTVASRFTADADEVARSFRTITGTLFREPIQFLALLVLALAISPLLTLVSFLIFPFIALLIRATGKVAKRNAKRVLSHRSRLLSILQEAFFGIRVVQTFGAEEREDERFQDENARLYDRNRRLVRVEALTSPAMEVLAVVGVAGALLVGGAMALDGRLTVGQFFAFYAAVGALYEPIRKLGSAVPRLQAGLAGAGRIFNYLDREPEIRTGTVALPPLSDSILLEDVGVTYGGRATALEEVTLEIRAGEQIAVVGASGAGKSTVAGLLPRLFDPDRGRVLFDGRDIREATLESLRGQIALVPQETILMNDTVRANIAFGRPSATDEEVREAARIAHVREFAERLPEGYDTVVGERGASLSGGQRQRIAIARAILAAPRVLILDEAVSSVDDESAMLIRSALAETREGRTTILISHRPEAIAGCDRVAVFARGSLIDVGQHEKLIESSNVYRDLVTAGTGGVRAGG